jgi:hypothetical protein
MNEMLMMQLTVTHEIFQVNTEGVTHSESLHQPASSGNCMNWIGGHLVTAYNSVLETLGQEPVWSEERIEIYKRGSGPLNDPTLAVDFEEICTDFGTAHQRVLLGLQDLAPARLSEPAPYSPGSNPDETLRSLLYLIAFHQAYHVGQLGLGRRLLGRSGGVS